MAAIPIIIPGAPQPIASFDFEDIVTGLGTVIFFGIASTSDSGTDYHLVSDSSVWSNPVGTAQNAVGTKSIDFDTSPFNLPRRAKGTAFFSAAIGMPNGGGTAHLEVTLIHVDSGAIETAITSKIVSDDKVLTSPTSEMVFLELPITEKHFKKGEVLRMTVDLVNDVTVSNKDVGHDPANQTFGNIAPGTADTTVMRLIMPFRIDA